MPQEQVIKENKMGTQPMLRLILSMSMPAMFSMFVQSLYNIVDSIFVARLGEEALTAVSLAFPVQILMISFAVGTADGINSLVSRRLGEKRQDEANAAASQGLVLCILTGLVFTVLGALFSESFISAFTQDEKIMVWGSQYTYIVTVFCIGCFIQINIEKLLQATGDMMYPMISQLIGAITNIVFDPIMIFGLLGFPRMEVAGAAIATVMGQIIGMIFCLIVLFLKKHEVKVTFKKFRFKSETIRAIYRVGFPSIVMQSVGSLLTTLLNFILSGFSDAAVAVLGGYYKLQSFIFMPVFGLMNGLMPIMGYNFGARKKERIYSAMKIGMIIASSILGAGTLLFELLPDKLLMIFNASDEMMQIGVIAFRLIAICFVPAAIDIVCSTLFQAIGMGFKSLVVSLLRQLVIILPLAYLFSKIGLNYVWLSFPIAEISSLVITVFILIDVFKKHINTLDNISVTQ